MLKKHTHLHFTVMIVFVIILVFLYIQTTTAAPMPPRPVINHQSKECAEIVPGDECGDVVLPTGWEYLDPSNGEQCPQDYTIVELSPDWVHFKVPHCCTTGHSGSPGDCQDVVIHSSSRQCAFVEDIEKCASLPPGWEARNENCPADFEWVEDVVCPQAVTSATNTPSTLQPTEKSMSGIETSTPSHTQDKPNIPAEKRNPLIPCASIGLVLVGVFGLKLSHFKQ
jgi:hypothetical protein